MFGMKKNSVFLKNVFIKRILFATVAVSFAACSNDEPLSSQSGVGGNSDLAVSETATSVSFEAKADSVRFVELLRKTANWNLFADPMAGVPFTVFRELRGDSITIVIENIWVNCGDVLENVVVRRDADSILDADLEFSRSSPDTEFSCLNDISFVLGNEFYDCKAISLSGEVMEQMDYRKIYPLNGDD